MIFVFLIWRQIIKFGFDRGHLLLVFLLLTLKISVQFSCSVMSYSSRPHESQHARPPCPSPTPGVHSNSCPSSLWCHPAISSSVVPFSSCPQYLPASGSFPMSQLFTWGGQSIEASASASGGSLGHTLICYYSQNRYYTKRNSTWRKKTI